jgi:hypothetical protein
LAWDSSSKDGVIIVNSHFISQSFPDIQRKKIKQAESGPQTPSEILWKWHLRYFITEMKLETNKNPSSWQLPWGYLLQLWDGHTSRGLLQVQLDGTLDKTLPFTSLTARTLSTMWPEWTLEDNCPSLSLQGRSVSHSHSQQSKGLMDLLGLVAEDWRSPGTLALFKINSQKPKVTIQVAGRPQSPTWCYLTSQVSFILHRSLWWGWMVSSTSPPPKKITILFKFRILIKVNFKIQTTN